MRNITVTVNDNTYLRARVWEARRDMSVSHLVRSILEDLPGFVRIFSPSLALKPDPSQPTEPQIASKMS
jgi:hypothetical protein